MDRKTPADMKPRSRRQQSAAVGTALFMGLLIGELIGWATTSLGLPALGGVLAIGATVLTTYFVGLSVGIESKEKSE